MQVIKQSNKEKGQGFRNSVSQLLRAQKIKKYKNSPVKIHNHKIKSNTRQAGETTTLITFKTDRLKNAGIFTVINTLL